jgi:hypothetical protein
MPAQRNTASIQSNDAKHLTLHLLEELASDLSIHYIWVGNYLTSPICGGENVYISHVFYAFSSGS